MAHLVAQYGATSGAVVRPQPELKFTITPRFFWIIAGTKARMTLNTPLMFTSITGLNSSGVSSQSAALRLMSAALLMSKSGAPTSARTAFAQASTCAGLQTSREANSFWFAFFDSTLILDRAHAA